MGSNKFMVIKFRELLKTVIFTILGAAIIIFLVTLILPDNEEAKYTPGVYTSSIEVDNRLMNVEVTVSENKIENVALVHTEETLPVFYPLFSSAGDVVAAEVLANQSTDIALPDDIAVTGSIILDAIDESLAKASAANNQ